jgi:hypothetical protein
MSSLTNKSITIDATGATNKVYINGKSFVSDDLKVEGGVIEISQLGSNNYEPGLKFWNYDADNAAGSGFSQIQFYNSKSDTETDTATDADAHLGRLLWYGNAGGSDGTKYASHIACRQTSAWGSGDYVGSELNFNAVAQADDGSTTSTVLSWAPPATPHANSGLNLIVNGKSAALTQPASSQIMIKKGTAPSTAIADYIFIGSKDSAGTGTDTKTTLELKLEEDVDATALDAVGTLTTRIPIWVNGTAYWLYLDPV